MNQRAEFTWKDTDGGLLVSVRGEIDHHTAAAIRTGMDALLFARRPARLVLDLSAVTFMDSSGLGLIMGRYGILRELGGSMCVRDPSPEIRGILTLAGMERRVRIEYPKRTPPAAPDRQSPRSGRAGSGRTAAPGRTGQKRRKVI